VALTPAPAVPVEIRDGNIRSVEGNPVAWLVTGGAGYIGAHVVWALRPTHDVVVLDDLSTGRLERLPGDVPLVKGSIGDPDHVDRLLRDHPVDGVIHLAARKAAAESVADPAPYGRDVDGVRNLLRAMTVAGVDRLVFASSAAVYGDVPGEPAGERRPLRPLNPYGVAKAAGERLIRDCRRPGFRSLIFRAFNVVGAGAHPYAMDTGPGGLLPAVFGAAAGGPAFAVHGTGLDTPDGTAVRDYVHVTDVARAYARAVDALRGNGPAGRVLNLGSGVGSSVLDVVRVAEDVTGRRLAPAAAPPRPGDAVEVVAQVRRAREWGWAAGTPLADAVRSAWASYAAQRG
jgi:UDP-glucose 4-epimerase